MCECGVCQAQCTDVQLGAFRDWPLLPTTAGQLCYVAYRHMLVLPPRSYILEESELCDDWPWLLPLLERVRCPVLDADRFPQCRGVCAPLPEWESYSPADMVLEKLMRVRLLSQAIAQAQG